MMVAFIFGILNPSRSHDMNSRIALVEFCCNVTQVIVLFRGHTHVFANVNQANELFIFNRAKAKEAWHQKQTQIAR